MVVVVVVVDVVVVVVGDAMVVGTVVGAASAVAGSMAGVALSEQAAATTMKASVAATLIGKRYLWGTVRVGCGSERCSVDGSANVNSPLKGEGLWAGVPGFV